MESQTPIKTPITSWNRFQLSLYSKGMLYTFSSGLHLFTFMVYFLILSRYISPFGYYNPTLWNGFYIFYTFVAAYLFYHGVKTLRNFMHSLPDYEEEMPNAKGYETERIDRT